MAGNKASAESYNNFPAHIIITDSSIERFEKMGTAMKLPKDTVIYKAGEVVDYCYLLKQGFVKTFEYTDAGDERIYSLVDEGSLLLELSSLLHTPLPISLATVTPSVVVKIPAKTLATAFATQPEVMTDMLWSINEKFVSIVEQLRESTSQSAEWKVCNLLLVFANRFGTNYDGKVLIREKLSQQMMADLLRVSRITVVRAIKSLKDIGLVEQVNGYYCIRSIEKLKQHMRYSDSLS